MSTGFFSHSLCRDHEMGAGHPECPERLAAIEMRLRASGLFEQLVHRQAPQVERTDLLRAHDGLLLAQVQELSRQAASGLDGVHHRPLDLDTSVNAHSWEAALRAAGAAVAATDAVITGEMDNAFCAVRPPGHYATRAQAMGFCFFNNVTVAALHALESCGLERVAIIDFDVHHGNGTQDIVAGDERILMVSFFQHPLYPFTGTEPGAVNLLNLPVPAHTRGTQIRALIETHWLPRLEAFAPQMVFVSAGFDAHRQDGLGQLELEEDDYAWITGQLMGVAQRHAHGRLVSCLEGGYHLDALARSVEAHLRVLAGL